MVSLLVFIMGPGPIWAPIVLIAIAAIVLILMPLPLVCTPFWKYKDFAALALMLIGIDIVFASCICASMTWSSLWLSLLGSYN